MDFRRIEIIFLAVFIMLDIFLFTSYTQARNSVVITNSAGHSTLEKEMGQDNITLEHRLSTKTGSGYYLASNNHQRTWHSKQNQLRNVSSNYNADKNQLNVTLDTPLTLPKSERPKYIQKFLDKSQNAIYGSQYRYSKYLSNSNTMVFVQQLQWGTLFDSSGKIEVKISNGRMNGYEQTYASNISVLRDKQNTISEQRAVNNLYTNNEIPSNSQIKWTRQGYTKLLTVKDSTIYSPVWYVCFLSKGNKVSEVRQVNAFNGTVMKEDSLSMVKTDAD